MFISLGGNCCIKYQLNKYGYNLETYPFDWCKISISQLILILQNNFEDYVESIFIHKKSNNHFLLNDFNKTSYIIKNKYNISFAHELSDVDKLDDFKNSINRRIKRFNETNINKIYVRIEFTKINLNYNEHLKKLLELIKPNKLILIIKNDIEIIKNENLIIYYYDGDFINWMMDNIDWNIIFKTNRMSKNTQS